MRTILDLAEDTSEPMGDGWPEPAVIRDGDGNGDVAIVLGDVELHLTILQFDTLLRAMTHWYQDAAAGADQDIAAGADLEPPPRAKKKSTRSKRAPQGEL